MSKILQIGKRTRLMVMDVRGVVFADDKAR